MRHAVLTVAALCLSTSFAFAGETAAPADAKVHIINLENGATVSSPVLVEFGLSGMGVAPAGVDVEKTGHHHLLIDRPPFGEGADDAMDAGLPSDDHHKHFGGGQTETRIELEPGEHTLQLVLGDMNHVPHDPPIMSEVITITVE
ncbi:DUF4399 domain-containing protein [Palleronia caenipelagi]|uniref:DUF4399 domain-containing protein n=1 Tax=Palleronia caenipelagi TaxID=2489174 RepID=A0A547Q370_9RHOB|nr:DUF4399 domain-containing protein [Palleronia caenipelagi]TRD20810.1 DUF4399 domain-containing protein [Palleronia caenipelagi]